MSRKTTRIILGCTAATFSFASIIEVLRTGDYVAVLSTAVWFTLFCYLAGFMDSEKGKTA